MFFATMFLIITLKKDLVLFCKKASTQVMSSHWIQSFICFILIDLQRLTMKFRDEGKALNIFIICRKVINSPWNDKRRMMDKTKVPNHVK